MNHVFSSKTFFYKKPARTDVVLGKREPRDIWLNNKTEDPLFHNPIKFALE